MASRRDPHDDRAVRRAGGVFDGRRRPSNPLIDFLARHEKRLSPKHQAIAQFVVGNPQFSSLASTRQLAEKTGADAATITRFAKALGFSGFNRLRQELRHAYLGLLDPRELIERQQDRSANVYRAAVLRDLHNLRNLLETMDTAALDRLAMRLLAARRTVLVAAGSYAAPALVLGHLCTALDLNVHVETRGRVYWVPRVATLTRRDLVVGISFWQCDRDTVDALRWAAAHGIGTAAITDNSMSPLAKHAALRIIVPTEGMLFFQSVTASLSVVYGIVARMWGRSPASRRAAYDRIRRAFRELEVFAG